MSQCEESSASQADSNSELEADQVRECWRGTALHAVYVKKKKKRSPPLRRVSSQRRTLSCCLLIPMATWSRPAGSASGRETLQKPFQNFANCLAPDASSGFGLVIVP